MIKFDFFATDDSSRRVFCKDPRAIIAAGVASLNPRWVAGGQNIGGGIAEGFWVRQPSKILSREIICFFVGHA